MSVKTLIDELLPYATGYNRTGQNGLIKLIEKAQDRLFDYGSAPMQWVGTDNKGFPTYLKTVAGTYRYDVKAANVSSGAITVVLGGTTYNVRCKRVLRVFIDTSKAIDYSWEYIGAPYLYSYQNPYTMQVDRLQVCDVPVESFPALENTDAYITFINDPGTATDKYFIEFVWEPPRLTSEQVPLVIPPDFEEALECYVRGTLQGRQNGRQSEWLYGPRGFYEYWKPKFEEWINRGTHIVQTKTIPRVC